MKELIGLMQDIKDTASRERPLAPHEVRALLIDIIHCIMTGAHDTLREALSPLGTHNAKMALGLLERYSFTVPGCAKIGQTIYAAKGFCIPAVITANGMPPPVDPFGWVTFSRVYSKTMARLLEKDLGFPNDTKILMLPGFFFRSYMAQVTVPQWLSLVFYHGEMLAEVESTLGILLPEDAEGRTYALRQGWNRGGLIFVMAYDCLSSVNSHSGGTCRVVGAMVRAFQNAMARLPGITASLGSDVIPLHRFCLSDVQR